MKLKTILPFLLFSKLALGVPEDQLGQLLKSEILPFVTKGEKAFYLGERDKKINYFKFKREHRSAIVIIPGRTEPSLKYSEILFDLKNLPVDFFLWDPRGQGHSERLLDDPQKGYVEKWEDYTSDFKKFHEIELSEYNKVFIIAHSMGAAISLRFGQLNPELIDGFVLSAPMVEIKTDGYPEFIASGLMKFLKIIGKKTEYVPGGGPLSGPIPYEKNRVTSSVERYKMARFIDTTDPRLLMGSPTNNWLYEAIQLGKKVSKKSQRRKIDHIPLIIFQAGKDSYSKDKRQRKLCEEHSQCELVRLEQAKHEMFQERDEIRNVVIKKTIGFIEKNL